MLFSFTPYHAGVQCIWCTTPSSSSCPSLYYIMSFRSVNDGRCLQNWLLQSVTVVQFLSSALPVMRHVEASAYIPAINIILQLIIYPSKPCSTVSCESPALCFIIPWQRLSSHPELFFWGVIMCILKQKSQCPP